MAAGPGWYDDGAGKQRWWDGERWTEHYIDLSEPDVELHSEAMPPGGPARAGWYDDGRGRQRWWDGARWTDATKPSGEERTFAGVTVDGRWVHFGEHSRTAAGARASVSSGADLLKRGTIGSAAAQGALVGPSGRIVPRAVRRSVVPGAPYLVVEVGGELWLTPVPAGQDAEAARFATWINTVAEHYRYR